MKIVHITHHYIDGWGYQDNILPEYQCRHGAEVTVVSDNNHLRYTQNPDMAAAILAKGAEYVINGVKIRKIKCYFNTPNTSLVCRGLYRILQEKQPDMIFHHGIDSSSLMVAAWYKKKHKGTWLFVDSHADTINETHNKIWDLCYNKVLLSVVVKLLGNIVDRYFGVTPLRCEYLHQKFGVPTDRIGFLPIGCDTYHVDTLCFKREELRVKYRIPQDAFVVVSGGKMDASKGTIELIKAIMELYREIPRLHLILFGKYDVEVAEAIKDNPCITNYGWCDRDKTLSLLALADVACWPRLHTTLIEDAVACEIPLIVKSSGNVRHFQKENNGIFLQTEDYQELLSAIRKIYQEYQYYKGVSSLVRDKFSYDAITATLKEIMKNSILFILHMPPPIHGAAMVGKYIHDSELINSEFDCHYINLATASRLEDIGKLNIKKVFLFCRLLRQIRKSVKDIQPRLVYITPNAKGGPFYKDYVVVMMLKKMGCKIVAHYHNKGVASRQDKWLDNLLYRWFYKDIKVILLGEVLYQDVKKYVKREDVYICSNGIPE